MNRVALFDADGTLNQGFSIFPVFEVFMDEGLIRRQDNDRLNEWQVKYNDGSVDFRTFVTGALGTAAEILKGRSLDTTASITESYFADGNFEWFGYVKPTMSEIKAAKIETILITAEPQFIAKSISAALNMTDYYGSQFGIEADGRFTGEVISALGSTQKGEIASRVIANVDHSTAFGDSEGDIGMLELVNQPVCIKPTEELRRHAFERDWVIVEDPSQPLTQVKFNL